MQLPHVLKKKSTIVIGILVLGGIGWYLFGKGGDGNIVYETAKVERRDIGQTVEVTGELKPASRIDLAFSSSGTIRKMNVRVGDAVKQGDVLAELKDDDVIFAERNAAASLAVAQANLNARLAGETPQAIRVAETQVEQAKAAYDKAVSDQTSIAQTTQDNIRSAEIAVQTAKNNLDNSGATVAQTVQNAYDSARTSLFTALGPLHTALTDGDQITGVENTASNEFYRSLLGILDSGSLDRAKASFRVAKSSKTQAETMVNGLNARSSKTQIQSAAEAVQTAIGFMQTYLTDVQKVLAASLTNSFFTSTDLAAKKTIIDADRTSVSTQNATVLSALQSIKNTELTETQTTQQLTDAYQASLTSLSIAMTNAQTQVLAAKSNVAIQKAALDAAAATLDLKKSGPRAVDVAGLRAAVAQAMVAYDKAKNDLLNIQIIAPLEGTIAEVIPDLGEQIMANAPAVRMIGTEQYDIEAVVPEADIAKVHTGQRAVITLDAYGDDVKFEGSVVAEEPDQTRIQDAVYYKIRVNIKPDGRDVKPGMTSNVTITTGESKQTLVIPLRAVRTKEGTLVKTVRVLVKNEPQEREITLGLRGDEGRVEVLSGLKEGEDVIVGQSGSGTVSK